MAESVGQFRSYPWGIIISSSRSRGYVRDPCPQLAPAGSPGSLHLFGSAVWALLPLVVLRQLNRGPSAYGILLGALGAGALVGTVSLPKFRGKISIEALVDCNVVLFGAVTLAAALTHSFALLIVMLLGGGIAWITLLSLFNVSARSILPSWIEARALAVYLLVFQGGTALGSLLWGAVAGRIGVQRSLLIPGIWGIRQGKGMRRDGKRAS